MTPTELAWIIHKGSVFRPLSGQTGGCHNQMGVVMSDSTSERSSRLVERSCETPFMLDIVLFIELQTRQGLDRIPVDRERPGGCVN